MIDKEEREGRAKIIVESSNGIYPPFEAFYIHSLLYSAARSLEAFDRYDHYKNSDVTAEDLISIVQEAVGHAAALSRFFWPSPQAKKGKSNYQTLIEARGKKLRLAFGLDESSPLYDRELRNAWEHFDERLDAYLLEHEAGMFFPLCIVDSHKIADDSIGHIFKLLDPKKECLVLMGRKYFFSPIRKEVLRIKNDCLRFDKQGRLPYEQSSLKQ